MNWLNLYKIIKEESPYYLMVFAFILLCIIFMPLMGSSIFKYVPEIEAFRAKYIVWIFILFIICAVFGIGGFIKKTIKTRKTKKEKRILLSKLESLCNETQIKTINDLIDWGHNIAPLLKLINKDYYITFTDKLNLMLGPQLPSYFFGIEQKKMLSIVYMAIKELKSNLDLKLPN